MTELRNVILGVWLALGLCACSNPEADRALIEAAKGGNLEQVNLAISDWGNVNAKGGKLMATPLHYATVHGHTPVVERLLYKGADVGLTDANGETPLHDAATFGRVDAAGMLLAHEADVNALTPEEETPLDYAIDANAEEEIGQRGAGGTVSAGDAAMPAAETLTEDTENDDGHAASLHPEDAPSQESGIIRHKNATATHHERSTSLYFRAGWKVPCTSAALVLINVFYMHKEALL